MMRTLLPCLMAALFLLLPSRTMGEVVERIVALVNNEVITLSELEETGRTLFGQVKQATLPSEREEKLKKARAEVLDQLIENKLLEQEIKRKKIEVPDRDVDQALGDIMKQNHLTENELKMALAKEGMTFSRYRQHIRDDLGKVRLVNWEIKSKIVVKEEDLKKAYQENLEEYTDPVEVKVQQVFLSVAPEAAEEQVAAIRKEAQSILERARRGEDFAQLARDYSRGPESREGGVLGFFKHKELMPELEEAAFKLPPGELSEPVRSKGGFHILRVLERKGGEPRPFAEVQNRVRDKILETEVEGQFKEWMKALKAKAYIEVRL